MEVGSFSDVASFSDYGSYSPPAAAGTGLLDAPETGALDLDAAVAASTPSTGLSDGPATGFGTDEYQGVAGRASELSPDGENTGYKPSLTETILRDGKAATSSADAAIRGGRFVGRYLEPIATAAEAAAPISKGLSRALPVLSAPVAGYDIYKAYKTWEDPKATDEQKYVRTAGAAFSTIATGAAGVALAFPPAAPIALPVAAVSGAGAFVADNWDTAKVWAGKAWTGLKSLF